MKQAFDDLNLSLELRRAVERLSNRIGSDPQHRMLVDELASSITSRDQNRVALLLNQGLNEFGSLYPLVAIAQMWETIGSVFEALGLDEETRLGTLGDINLWIDHHREANNGENGLSRVFWVNRLITARIIQFGRLQFEERLFPYPVILYQDPRSDFVAIPQSGLALDSSGYLTRDEKKFIRLTNEHEYVHLEKGSIASLKRDLPTLTKLADSTTSVLFVHIPASGSLEPSLVDQSLEQAQMFFGGGRLYVCTSWLLDPALSKVVEAESNIWLFNQRFKKLPVFFDSAQIFERVFDGVDEESVPLFDATTSLQRNAQRALNEGVVFRTMGGFFLR